MLSAAAAADSQQSQNGASISVAADSDVMILSQLADVAEGVRTNEQYKLSSFKELIGNIFESKAAKDFLSSERRREMRARASACKSRADMLVVLDMFVDDFQRTFAPEIERGPRMKS